MSPRAGGRIEPGSAHSRLGLFTGATASGDSVVARAAAPQMTTKIQKVAVGGGKFEMRRILVPVKVAATTVSPTTSSAGIMAAESRLAATFVGAAVTPAGVAKTTSLKRSLSTVVDIKSG